jgi:hypothetical protein
MQIDGLTVTYNEIAGTTQTISHGTQPGSNEASLQRKEFSLSGTSLFTPLIGTQINELY